MNTKERRQIQSLSSALDVLCEARESMPLRQAMAFLSVAMHESTDKYATLEEVGRDTGAPAAVVSRDLLGLGPRTRLKKPGLGLIESFSDYQDLRRKPYRLTADGKKLLKKLLEELR